MAAEERIMESKSGHDPVAVPLHQRLKVAEVSGSVPSTARSASAIGFLGEALRDPRGTAVILIWGQVAVASGVARS
jgi:hypothetical protein